LFELPSDLILDTMKAVLSSEDYKTLAGGIDQKRAKRSQQNKGSKLRVAARAAGEHSNSSDKVV
jgi:hypothetical protein